MKPCAITSRTLFSPADRRMLVRAQTEWTRPGIEKFVKLEAMPSALEFLPHTVPIIFDNSGDANAPNHMILFTSSKHPQHTAAVPSRPRAIHIKLLPANLLVLHLRFERHYARQTELHRTDA